MRNYLNYQGFIPKAVLLSTLATGGFSIAAETSSSITLPATAAKGTPLAISKKKSSQSEAVMTVTALAPEKQAGSKTTITAAEMQKKGTNDFGSVMRYEPLISATGVSGGSSSGKSGFDRSGYTGYNIRGLESNRVGLDVDGIPQPDATGRSYVSRAGLNTFGIGRDYIDPYMYG